MPLDHEATLAAIEASFTWTEEELQNEKIKNREFLDRLLATKALRTVMFDPKFKLLSVETRDLVRDAITALE